MAIIASGADATRLLTIDPTHLAARVSGRPLEHGAGGHYRYTSRSGTIGAALAAGALLFGFRFVSASLICVVTSIKVKAQANVAFTAAGANLALAALVGRAYTASHTGGTAATVAGNNLKLRTSFPTSQFAGGDIRLATFAALGGGTITLDAQPFAYGGPGRPNNINAAAGTEFIEPWEFGSIDFKPRILDGEYPLVLATNEGFVLRNEVVWPAAGTAEVSIEVQWSEVATY